LHWWRANVEELRELEEVWDAVNPDVVFHLSGAVNGVPQLDLLLPTYHSLLTTTVNLLNVATRRGCRRLILIGSLEEHDPGSTTMAPASPYAAAKTAAHQYACMCHQLFGTPIVILRTFMCYGPGQPEWKLIPSTIRALGQGMAPALSSGRRELDWIYIDDVVDAFAAAAVAVGIEGRTLDIGSGRLTSIREIVERLVRLIDPSVVPRFGELPDRPARPVRAANTSETLRYLGWQAHITLEDGLLQTVRAFGRT